MTRPARPQPGPVTSRLPHATVTRLVPQRTPDTRDYGLQGTLALDLDPRVPGPPSTPELEPRSAARLGHVDDAEVRAWSARFAQAVVESVGGQRPVSQLVRWTSPTVYRDLDRRAQLVRQALDGRARAVHPQVRSVHVFRPTPDSAEVSVHVRHGQRSRALAVRLERHRARWCCVALEFC